MLNPGLICTGKSVNTSKMLNYGMSEEYLTLTRTFSVETSANQAQDYLDNNSKLEERVFTDQVSIS